MGQNCCNVASKINRSIFSIWLVGHSIDSFQFDHEPDFICPCCMCRHKLPLGSQICKTRQQMINWPCYLLLHVYDCDNVDWHISKVFLGSTLTLIR